MPNDKKRFITPSTALILALLTFPLPGCQRDTGKTDVQTPSLEGRVKAIESNPDIPPGIKKTAVQQMKAVEAGLNAANAAQEKKKDSP